MLKIIYRVTKEQIKKIKSGGLPQKLFGKKRIFFVRPGQQGFNNENNGTGNGKWDIGVDLEGCERLVNGTMKRQDGMQLTFLSKLVAMASFWKKIGKKNRPQQSPERLRHERDSANCQEHQ